LANKIVKGSRQLHREFCIYWPDADHGSALPVATQLIPQVGQRFQDLLGKSGAGTLGQIVKIAIRT
jgi:hypothetical protein